MRKGMMLTRAVLAALWAGSAGPALADPAQEARAVLEGHGIEVRGGSLAIRAEAELGQGVRAAAQLKKKLTASSRKLETSRRQQVDAQQEIMSLKKQAVQLNARLAGVDERDVMRFNRLAAAVNAVHGRISLLNDQKQTLSDEMEQLRKDTAKDRTAYLQHVVDLRALADRIGAEYTAKAADPEVQAAIAQLSTATGTAYKLSPSRYYRECLRRLKQLEDAVLTDSIPFTRRDGNALYVNVVVNGEHTQEMIVDSGAGMVSLPREMAARLGIQPTESDPTIGLLLADGSQIQGQVVRIASVRVGKFVAKDVECTVLGPEAANALPLLGMSFLRNFKFEIDADAGTLEMTAIEVPGSESAGTRR